MPTTRGMDAAKSKVVTMRQAAIPMAMDSMTATITMVRATPAIARATPTAMMTGIQNVKKKSRECGGVKNASFFIQ